MEKLKREKSLSNWAEYWESCKGFFDDKSDIEQTEFWDERWQKRKNSISKFHKPGATRSRMNGIFEILDEAGFKIKGSHILDIGSGPGAMSIPFAKAGARVTALDISPKAIEQLQRYAEKNGLDIKGITSSWWTADIDRLGLRNRFDLVFVTRTPAVKDAESLDRMMQCSKAFCFYSFFIQKHGYWHMTDDEVIKNILEKHKLCNTSQKQSLFVNTFLYLYLSGYHPLVKIERDKRSTSINWEDAADQTINSINRFESVTPGIKKEIRRYYKSNSKDGKIRIRHNGYTGVMVWDVRKKSCLQ